MQRRTAAGAAFYAAIGVGALLRPRAVPALFGATAPTAAARTEVRAVYGGLPLALTALLLGEADRADRPATRAVAVLSAGMALGRLGGVLVEGEADRTTWLLLAAEAATAAALGSVAGASTAGGPVAPA